MVDRTASQIAAREEDTAAAVVALDAWLLAEMGGDGVDHDVGANQARPRLVVAIDTAQARTEVAVLQMFVGQRSLLGRVNRREELVARQVVIEQERRCQVQPPGLKCPPLQAKFRAVEACGDAQDVAAHLPWGLRDEMSRMGWD